MEITWDNSILFFLIAQAATLLRIWYQMQNKISKMELQQEQLTEAISDQRNIVNNDLTRLQTTIQKLENNVEKQNDILIELRIAIQSLKTRIEE
jgi:CII-binding regulator of phage lambda lysogenization HflD